MIKRTVMIVASVAFAGSLYATAAEARAGGGGGHMGGGGAQMGGFGGARIGGFGGAPVGAAGHYGVNGATRHTVGHYGVRGGYGGRYGDGFYDNGLGCLSAPWFNAPYGWWGSCS